MSRRNYTVRDRRVIHVGWPRQRVQHGSITAPLVHVDVDTGYTDSSGRSVTRVGLTLNPRDRSKHVVAVPHGLGLGFRIVELLNDEDTLPADY